MTEATTFDVGADRAEVAAQEFTLWVGWQGEATASAIVDLLPRLRAGDRVVVHGEPGWDLDRTGDRLAELLRAAGRVDRAGQISLSAAPPSFADVVDGRHVQVGPEVPGLDVPTLADLRDAGALDTLRQALPQLPVVAQRLRSDRVVEVALMGGLGNQLFQYAFARAVADRVGADLVADLEWFGTQSRNAFELGAYRVRLDAVVHGAADRAALGCPPLRRRQEGSFRHDPSLEGMGPGISLHGYFQSEKYFLTNASRLREDLLPARPLTSWARDVADAIAALPNATSVHVRRGDYASDPDVQAVHGTCAPVYYERALDVVGRLAGDVDAVVFSDDPDWAQDNVSTSGARSVFIVRPPTGSPAWESLYLMTLVRQAIIANSTFSWWGAWLRSVPGPVVAPRPWFRADMDTRDLLPPTWLTVDAR